jgi:tetraacyldisaccharide-1-P 4'-kinase
MYDWGIFSSTKFKTPIIGVGNLSVGGSGKSPMVMYLADLLSKTSELAFYQEVTEEKPKATEL